MVDRLEDFTKFTGEVLPTKSTRHRVPDGETATESFVPGDTVLREFCEKRRATE